MSALRNLLFLAFVLSIVSSYSFAEYKADFNRVYGSAEEEAAREAAFNQKMAYYQQFNSEGHGYTLGPTIWTDRFDEESQSTP